MRLHPGVKTRGGLSVCDGDAADLIDFDQAFRRYWALTVALCSSLPSTEPEVGSLCHLPSVQLGGDSYSGTLTSP